MLALLLILMWSQAGSAPAPFTPVPRAEFERVKTSDDFGRATALRDANLAAVRDAALQRRGHSGDLTYLQGCDISDQDTEFAVASLELIAASPDWESYASALRAADIAAPAEESAVGETAEVVARAAAHRDQTARSRFAAALPDGQVGEAVWALRLVSMCRMDLASGRWLDSVAAKDLFATSTDDAVLHDLWVLAIHADHLPRLQDDYGEMYLRRRQELGLPAEPGLRLKDRSRVNLGLPQIYATGVICDGRQPVFAGRVELASANLLRSQMGLPPQDLERKLKEKFCG